MGVPALPKADTLTDKLGELSASLIGFARGRLDLLRREADEAGARIGALAARALVVVVFTLVAMQTAALGVIAIFWDTPYRVAAIFMVALAAAAGAAAGLRAYWLKQAQRSTLFAATSAELAKDERALRESL